MSELRTEASVSALFEACRESRTTATRVRRYIAADLSPGPGVPSNAVGIQMLSIQLVAKILAQIPFPDRWAFSRTCRWSRTIFASVVQLILSDQLRYLRLDFMTLHILQAATGAIVSGAVLWDFFHPGASVKQKKIRIYCAAGDGQRIVRYIRNMTDMKVRAYCAQPSAGRFDGVAHVWWMSSKRLEARSAVLQIMESLSLSSRDALMFCHSTFMICSWSATELWHGYPALTFGHQSITSPTRVPLPRHSVGSCLNPYKAHGMSFESELDSPHMCGSHFSCPVTLRHTSDDGCLTIPLPKSTLVFDRCELLDTVWSLGGQGCSRGFINGLQVHRSISFATDEIWKEYFETMLTIPPDVVADDNVHIVM